MSQSRWQATYAAMSQVDDSLGSFRTLEAHASHWTEARNKLPKYIYPAGRRYRRISGPTTVTGQ